MGQDSTNILLASETCRGFMIVGRCLDRLCESHGGRPGQADWRLTQNASTVSPRQWRWQWQEREQRPATALTGILMVTLQRGLGLSCGSRDERLSSVAVA